jgi:hypothetical protein
MAKDDGEKATVRPKVQRSEKLTMISALYDRLLDITAMAIRGGEANLPMGLMGMAILEDIGHGGAYSASINKRPYFMTDPSSSKWYAGPGIKNIDQGGGLGGYFASLFSGQNAADLFKQVMMDANVPHVLPKLISDEQYAQFWIIYSQLATTELFQKAGTGLATLVEGLAPVGKSVSEELEARRKRREEEGYSETEIQRLAGTLALAANAAKVAAVA